MFILINPIGAIAGHLGTLAAVGGGLRPLGVEAAGANEIINGANNTTGSLFGAAQGGFATGLGLTSLPYYNQLARANLQFTADTFALAVAPRTIAVA